MAISATAHNGLEKLSHRLAELQKEGVRFNAEESAGMIAHLEAAKTSASICIELIKGMSPSATDAPAPTEIIEKKSDEYEPPPGIPEDEMFPAGDVLDPLTGLPGRSIALKAIQSALNVGRPRFAAMFAIDRLRYMSARYGNEAGQLVIKQYAAYLRQKMPADTMLFRWSGGSILGLFDLSSLIGDARAIADHTSTQKIKLDFESDQRRALLNLTSTAMVQGLGSISAAEDVTRDLDDFVEMHSRKQPD